MRAKPSGAKPFDHSIKIPPERFVVSGMIPCNALTFIIAQEGIGKSFFVEDLAERIVHGDKFMGRLTTPSKVHLIDQDTPTNTLHARLKAFKKGINKEQIYDLYVESFKNYSLSDGSLISAIEKSDAEVVIIDSLHSVCGKLNPNQVKDMQYLSKLKQSVLDKGKTLIITHHISAHKNVDVESIMGADRVGMHSMGSSFIS